MREKKVERARDRTVNLLIRTEAHVSNDYCCEPGKTYVKRLA